MNTLTTNLAIETTERKKQDTILENNLLGALKWEWNIVGENNDILDGINIKNLNKIDTEFDV